MKIFARIVAALVVLSWWPALTGCDRLFPSQRHDGELPPGAIPVPASSPLAVSPAPPPAVTGAVLPPAAGSIAVPMSFAVLAKTADPGVVTILSRIERLGRNGRRRLVGEGLGTGFVYDRNGLILTNNHVVTEESADFADKVIEISVKLADGRELPATIVGRDKHTDVAVVRVDERNLVPLPLGDSDAIEVGDWVVAIGNPFGLSHTVSAGILSAKGRTAEDVKGLDPSGYFNFLQTDAAINQGNSGGPLLNLRGEVVGINAAIRANANSIGFAIPINMVKQLLPILLRDGKIVRSALGVVVDSVSESESVRLKRQGRKGALVKMVVPGGGADKAGIQPDDVIVGFDGKPIDDPNQLRWLASIAGVGKTATVRIQRGDKMFDMPVKLQPLRGLVEDGDDSREP